MENSLILRIDDRLIHGQVLVGWGTHYPFQHYIVGNDEYAQNEWERNLLLMAVPDNLDAQVLSLKDTVSFVTEHLHADALSMVLIRTPQDLKAMADYNLPQMTINVGGVHFEEGRKQLLPYLFLNDAEVAILRELLELGYAFECQDIPTNSKSDLVAILEKY